MEVKQGVSLSGAPVVLNPKELAVVSHQLWYEDEAGIIRSKLNGYVIDLTGSPAFLLLLCSLFCHKESRQRLLTLERKLLQVLLCFCHFFRNSGAGQDHGHRYICHTTSVFCLNIPRHVFSQTFAQPPKMTNQSVSITLTFNDHQNPVMYPSRKPHFLSSRIHMSLEAQHVFDMDFLTWDKQLHLWSWNLWTNSA